MAEIETLAPIPARNSRLRGFKVTFGDLARNINAAQPRRGRGDSPAAPWDPQIWELMRQGAGIPETLWGQPWKAAVQAESPSNPAELREWIRPLHSHGPHDGPSPAAGAVKSGTQSMLGDRQRPSWPAHYTKPSFRKKHKTIWSAVEVTASLACEDYRLIFR